MSATDLPTIVAALLALAALLAGARLWRSRHRLGRARFGALLLAQPLLAALLHVALFPPLRPTTAGAMTVLTAGGSAAASGERRITLPEARADANAEAVPDLATALRRHPEVQRLHVVGAGLEARDLDAAGGLPLTFTASTPPVGLVELQAPARVAAGNAFAIRGRIAGVPAAIVELRDPAGQRVQRGVVDHVGDFVLRGSARTEGLATFSLHIADRAGVARETLPLPLQVVAPPQPRVLMLAGAPSPELKYLRRWAADAGIATHVRMGTGAGLVLGDAPIAFDAATLRRFDAVLLDVRSLRALGNGELATLTAAVRSGLGVLLRLDEPLRPADRARLRRWGLVLEAGSASQPVQLAGDPDLPALTRRMLRMDAADAVPVLRDTQQRPLASWRSLGRGRVAVLALDDTFQWVLGGHAARHAGLWSGLLAAIARAPDAAPPSSPATPAWPGERLALCGLHGEATVVAPDGNTTPLAIDPATGLDRCAAFWPRTAGWHLLRDGDTDTPFPVLPAAAGVALRAQQRRDATFALAARGIAAPARAGTPRRGSSWPWFLAWLALAALAWWLERRPVAPASVPAATNA